MKARGAGKKFHEIIARNVEGGADSRIMVPLLQAKNYIFIFGGYFSYPID